MGLALEVPDSCPKDAAFIERVRFHVPDASFPRIDALRTALVQIEEDDAGFFGSLRIDGEPGAIGQRDVRGESCEDVEEALALVIALSLTRTSQTRSGVEAAAGPPAPPPPEQVEPAIVDSTDNKEGEPSIEEAQRQPASQATRSKKNTPLSRRPSWVRPFRKRHETITAPGKLVIESLFSLDVQGGFSLGLLPGTVVPRLDFTGRTVFTIIPPGSSGFMLGIIPRLRMSLFLPASVGADGYSSELTGAGYAMGACASPYYNEKGLVLLGCAEYGGGILGIQTKQSELGFDAIQTISIGRMNLTFEAEYALGSIFHLATRAGLEANTIGDPVIRDENGDELLRLGSLTFVATAGLGVHF